MKPYCTELYDLLFSQEEPTPHTSDPGIVNYRVKTITSGKLVECEIYPIWSCQKAIRRVRAAERSSSVQENLNDSNAKKKVVRLVHANFDSSDIMITLSYDGIPPTESQARRDIRNYLRRVREYRRKRGLSELKYLYVIEFEDGSGNKTRIHHHVVMSGMDRDTAETLWGKGFANSRRLQMRKRGLKAISKYIMKGRKRRQWSYSQNLKTPNVTIADRKITLSQAKRLALDNQKIAPALFERLYPGRRYIDSAVKFSAFAPGAYIYVELESTHSHKSKAATNGATSGEAATGSATDTGGQQGTPGEDTQGKANRFKPPQTSK